MNPPKTDTNQESYQEAVKKEIKGISIIYLSIFFLQISKYIFLFFTFGFAPRGNECFPYIFIFF